MSCRNPSCGAALPPGKRLWCGVKCAQEVYHDRESAEVQARRRAQRIRCADCPATFAPKGERGRPPERCPDCREERSRAMRREQRRRARMRRR